MKKKKHVASKKPVIYTKMNLMLIIKNIKRLERILITLENTGAAHVTCNLRYKGPAKGKPQKSFIYNTIQYKVLYIYNVHTGKINKVALSSNDDKI